MKTILVSGASGILGYGILRSLRRAKQQYRLIGTSIYVDSVAQGFSDIFEQAPLTSDPGYIDWLSQLIIKHRIDLIIPGIVDDMFKWSESLPEIKKSGAQVLLNNLDLIALSKDKWFFYENLVAIKSPYAIESTLDSNFDTLVERFGLPFLLKPREGFGSKGIVRVYNFDDFIKHRSRIGPVLMVQPVVGHDNEEFTAAAFCDGNGGFFASMVLKRKLSKDGYTEKAEVVCMEAFDEVLRSLCEHFKPIGPTNFQFRKHHGTLKLLEINPRISCSTSIRSAFGYNEAEMAIEFYLDGKMPSQPVISYGRAVRYVEDCIFP